MEILQAGDKLRGSFVVDVVGVATDATSTVGAVYADGVVDSGMTVTVTKISTGSYYYSATVSSNAANLGKMLTVRVTVTYTVGSNTYTSYVTKDFGEYGAESTNAQIAVIDGNVDDIETAVAALPAAVVSDLFDNHIVGTGPYTITITCTDGTDPLEDVRVSITKGVDVRSTTTNASGVAVFNVVTGTWTASAAMAGYEFTSVDIVVDGNETQTMAGTAVVIPSPTSADQVACYATTYDAGGNVKAGVTVQFSLERNDVPASGIFERSAITRVSDSNGLVVVNLQRGAEYELRVTSGTDTREVKKFYVPSTGSSFLLPVLC